MTLQEGETIRLNTRVDGGPTIKHSAGDEYSIDDNADVLSRAEIARLAELAGLEVQR